MADLLRYRMVAPFSPQNVQCIRSPHQQPRDVSMNVPGCQIGVEPAAAELFEVLAVVGIGQRVHRFHNRGIGEAVERGIPL